MKLSLEGLGSVCLGILIGGLVTWYVKSQEHFNLGGLIGVVSVLAGSGVIAVFRLVDGRNSLPTRDYWLYPVGLLIGAVCMMLLLIARIV
jgi:hypothetical protein